MWNYPAPSSLLMPFSDDYVKREPSNSPAGSVGFDKILPTDYDHLRHHMSFSPSLQRLQTSALFSTRSSESYLGESSIYNGVIGPAFTQFNYTQPATAATHVVKWTAAGEPIAGDGSSFRSSKRLKTTATATAEGPRHRLQCSAKPRNQTLKAPCKRSQKLGDKITALQQLVSPYGKTDTASVLHEAAACIRNLHEQIQILAAPYPGIISPASSSQDTEEELATGLRRRGLCIAPLSPAVVSLVSDATRSHGGHTDMEGSWFSAL